jgi:uncharacterized SAM-binding protein YcdF (DUF218 family)
MGKQWSNNKGIILIIGIFIFVLSIDIGMVYLYYRHVQNFITSQQDIKKADAGVVFFGDYLDDKITLGPDSKKRALTAVKLYEKGKINKIICVGGYEYSQWKGKHHSMSQFIIEQGVPKSCIIYDSLSYNTITNWREAQKIIEREKFNHVIAISSPLHVFRISLMVDMDNFNCASYQYSFNDFEEYWGFFLDVHHEWMSHFLNFALKDDVRNRMVYTYRVIRNAIKNIL